MAAGWFLALLQDRPLTEAVHLPLERVVWPGGPPVLTAGVSEVLVFDASPWGGGVIHFSGRAPLEYVILDWGPSFCKAMGVEKGSSKYLAFFESVTALVGIELWTGASQLQTFGLVGDNIAALTAAVSTRGRGDVAKVCREIALRQARQNLVIAVGHIPSELNTWADALSRVHAPSPAGVPPQLLSLPRRAAPVLEHLFSLEFPTEPADRACAD